MREKIGERPYEVSKSGSKYLIKFYPMIKKAKYPSKVLFCLTVTKGEFDALAKLRNMTSREKVGTRPYQTTKSGDKFVIKFYPLVKAAKEPDRVLFCLTATKKEFDTLAVKIK